jgi:hypothetical protein
MRVELAQSIRGLRRGCYHLFDTCSRLGYVSISKRLQYTLLLFYLACCLFTSPRLLLLIVSFNTRRFSMAKVFRTTYAVREATIGRVNRSKAPSFSYSHVFFCTYKPGRLS